MNSSVYLRSVSLCAAGDIGHLLCKSKTNTNTSLLTIFKGNIWCLFWDSY